VFRVNFPSKAELVRVQHFARFHVPDSTIVLLFDAWKKDVQPAWIPEDVWVRVSGLPPVALDDYLALWALGDVFGKTKELDITFTRQNNVLCILITCLDTNLIPETWDLKIKNEFFRLRFEVEGEQPTIIPDVTMSEAPGDGEDDDHNIHDKSGGIDGDRTIKRTKNAGEKNNEIGAPNSQQNTNAKSVDRTVPESSAVGVNSHMTNAVVISESTPRYDDVLFTSYKDCISPKHLFSSFSAVAEKVDEYVPTIPITTTVLDPSRMLNVEDASMVLSGGKGEVQLERSAPTSIKTDVHAARTLEHAATGQSSGGDRASGLRSVASCGPSLRGHRPAASCGPVLPAATVGQATPLGGTVSAARPFLHGISAAMHGATTTSATITSVAKVKKTPSGYIDNISSAASFKQTAHDSQGNYLSASTSVGMNKEVPNKVSYTQEQIVAFGGIQEESRRDVRSSGRLRTQPNADMTQMERAMMVAKKRAEIPVIGMSVPKPTSIMSFSDDQIIDNARSLGVSLGNSHSECIKAAKLIKDNELQRSITMLNSNDQLGKNSEDASFCLAVSRASELCDDLEAEEDLLIDGDVDIPRPSIRDKKIRKKKSYEKKEVRRSNRIRIKPSKLQ
jgi:hypothetical protein